MDQYERFQEQQALRDAGDEEAQMMDEDFVEALEYGMPPAAGFAYSERLFAMLMDKPVRELQFFPLMKPEGQIPSTAKKLNSPEIFSINEEVGKKFPSASIGVAIIKGVKIEKLNPDLEKEKTDLLKSFDGLTTEQLGQYPEIQSYRKLYKETRID